MLPVLSKRLETAAALVPEQAVLADVGTDHGYVPVRLFGQGRISRAIAMDINRGPLERAREHIRQYGMEAYIQTRLSDGVAALSPGEADAVLIAGMGGGLILHILSSGGAVCRQAEALVLQPQSETGRVREFLLREGYVTDAEEMVEEDGKFYPMMRVRYEPQAASGMSGGSGGAEGRAALGEGTAVREAFGGSGGAEGRAALGEGTAVREASGRTAAESGTGLRYGSLLLAGRHPVLLRYLERERRIHREILRKLEAQRETEQIRERIRQVREILALNEEALARYR